MPKFPKAVLRLVVSRKPVPYCAEPEREDALHFLKAYVTETLECGHKVDCFFNPPVESLIAKRRRCRECSEAPKEAPKVVEAAAEKKKPLASVAIRPSQWTERILAYLKRAENKERDAWLREDIRIAWITTLWSQKGVPEWSWRKGWPPYVAATYQVLNCYPEEVWPRIVARRRELFGASYDRYYDDAGNRIPEVLSPKKPCASERRRASRKKKAASRDLAA